MWVFMPEGMTRQPNSGRPWNSSVPKYRQGMTQRPPTEASFLPLPSLQLLPCR